MATPGILDVTSGQIEVVERDFQLIFEESDALGAKIRKSEKVQQVSRYLYRLPFMKYRGGAFRKISANNSSLGSGTGMVMSNFTAGYITTIRAYRVTREQKNTTSTKKQSVVDVFAETAAHALQDAMVDDDIGLHQDGTGILTNASSAATTTTLTFAGATDYIGINRLREGMVIDIWDAALTTNLTSALTNVTITAIDYINKKITIDQAVATLVNQTNVVTIANLPIYGPATPTSFSSTWPDRTVAGGLGGDSFRHGFPYVHDITSTNYYLGVLKSSIPQIVAARVSASNGGISFDHGQLLIDQWIQRRGSNDEDVTAGVLGVMHQAQRMAIQKLGTTINNVYIPSTSGDAGKSKDLLPTNHQYKDTTMFCGIPMMVSKRQDKSRLDFLMLSKWFRAELHPVRFYDEDGKKFFEGRGSDGTVQTFVEFFVEASYDHSSMDPGRDGLIDQIAVPTGA